MKKVIISTGGTGGHIYPALALAEKLKEKEVEVLFVGTKYRMEKDIIPEKGYRFIALPMKPLMKLRNIFNTLKSILKSIKIVLKEKPDAIIGFGNYITVPVLLAGLIFRKKIYLHEQNVSMGLANKLFYRFAKKLFLTFEETFSSLPVKYQNKVIVSGNPMRKEFYSIDPKKQRKKLKLEEGEKILLIVGGSLGAKSINDAMFENWDKFLKEKNLRVYWATGKNNFSEINGKLNKMKANDVVKPYFENVAEIMAASDIVLSRAGASIITELIELQKASVLIPYNYVGQMQNAKVLEKVGGTLVYSDENVLKAIDKIFELNKNEKVLEEMSYNLKKLKKGDAASKIIDELDIWRN